MYFCSQERLLIKRTENGISCTNLYTNQKYELGHNLCGKFWAKNISDKLYIMYAKDNGNLYKTTLSEDKLSTECILERKNGEGTVTPYGIITLDGTKWYLYGIISDEQEIIALQKSDDIPETVASGKNILFDYCEIDGKLYFCFNDVGRVIVKIYDLNLNKWDSSQIVKYDFEKLIGVKALEKDKKLVVVATGKVRDNFIKTVLYTYEKETVISEYDTKGEPLSLVFSADNSFVLESGENYIVIHFNGEVREYPLNDYSFYKVLFADRTISVFIKNKAKIKRELEIYVLKNKSYKKLKNKIEYVKRELSYNEKEILKITDETCGVF